MFIINQYNIDSDEDLNELFGLTEEGEYNYGYCSMGSNRSHNCIDKEYTEYLITLTFLEDGFAKLLNTHNVGYCIDNILCKKKHMYHENILDFVVFSITQKNLIFRCKALMPDLNVINKAINELKSDLSCLTMGKVFKKQHCIEKNELMRLYNSFYDLEPQEY